MKKISILLIILSVLIVSCKKEDVKETVNNAAPLVTTASMSAKVNDTLWTSVTRVTNHYDTTGFFLITGTSTEGQVIAITIKGETEGTYTSSTAIDSLSAQVGCVWQPDASSPTEDNFISKSGEVVVTSLDTVEKRISGTFKFDMINTNLSATKTIREGKFSNLKYSEK